MLLGRLSVTVLAALAFGTSWAWPAVQPTQPGSIEVASNRNSDQRSSLSGSNPLRSRLGLARKRSILEPSISKSLDGPTTTQPSKRRLVRRATFGPVKHSVASFKGVDFDTVEEYQAFWKAWGECKAKRFQMFRNARPQKREEYTAALEEWYALRPQLKKPDTIEDMIDDQCENEELNRIKWTIVGKKWPGNKSWDDAEAKLRENWEKRHAKEIEQRGPGHEHLTTYFRKAEEMGLTNLPQIAQQLPETVRQFASGMDAKIPAWVQGMAASVARSNAAPGMRKFTPGKVLL
ncbi:MAG: hypothetical protein M1823_005062 [Watsoniomyces obsoletus]|nr:MAG: hypothetical protein M1823_005062 [Watsoniomyces obsoletus]